MVQLYIYFDYNGLNQMDMFGPQMERNYMDESQRQRESLCNDCCCSAVVSLFWLNLMSAFVAWYTNSNTPLYLLFIVECIAVLFGGIYHCYRCGLFQRQRRGAGQMPAQASDSRVEISMQLYE